MSKKPRSELPYEERLAKITHYYEFSYSPCDHVHCGWYENGFWVEAMIDMHKKEAKRKRLKLKTTP